MKHTLLDFNLNFMNVPIMCDNTSAINLTKNPIQHSRTKHIEIRHHFIRELVHNKEVHLAYVPTKEQLADIFTKALPREQFEILREKLNILDFQSLN